MLEHVLSQQGSSSNVLCMACAADVIFPWTVIFCMQPVTEYIPEVTPYINLEACVLLSAWRGHKPNLVPQSRKSKRQIFQHSVVFAHGLDQQDSLQILCKVSH